MVVTFDIVLYFFIVSPLALSNSSAQRLLHETVKVFELSNWKTSWYIISPMASCLRSNDDTGSDFDWGLPGSNTNNWGPVLSWSFPVGGSIDVRPCAQTTSRQIYDVNKAAAWDVLSSSISPDSVVSRPV